MINLPISCAICGKLYTRLGTHVRVHGIMVKDYRKQFWGVSYAEILNTKINELFITTRKKWGHGFEHKLIKGATGYRTNNAERHKVSKTPFFDRSLTDQDIRRHLRGKTPVIVHAKDISKFLCFDVDSKMDNQAEGFEQAKQVTKQLITCLKLYIAENDIHVEDSAKGFHVWVFFDNLIPIPDLLLFAKYVTSFNANNELVHIELRPESEVGKGVKLPSKFT